MNDTNLTSNNRPTEEQGSASHVAELEGLRDRFADTLTLLIPSVDHRLLILTQGDWPHSVAFEVRILSWLEDVILSAPRTNARHETLLDDDDSTVHVMASHLIDDHWWVSAVGTREIVSEDGPSGSGLGVSIAKARIKGGGRRLTYNSHNSAKFS